MTALDFEVGMAGFFAILAGFAYKSRVMVRGYHGSGKTCHIVQVATRLNWVSGQIS